MKAWPGLLSEPPLLVGNDVVDLDHRSCRGKSGDRRFLERVLAPTERARVAAAPDPDRALWIHWAAKEAAFKVVSKLMGDPPTFAHVAFVVEPDAAGDIGMVKYEDWAVPWSAEPVREECLHVLAWSARPMPDGSSGGAPGRTPGVVGIRRGIARLAKGAGIPRERFSEREGAAIRTAPSAWVRIHARAALARTLGVGEDLVEVVTDPGAAGRMPPRALVEGRPSSWDVSLSHHGRWLGWALASGPPQGRS